MCGVCAEVCVRVACVGVVRVWYVCVCSGYCVCGLWCLCVYVCLCVCGVRGCCMWVCVV